VAARGLPRATRGRPARLTRPRHDSGVRSVSAGVNSRARRFRRARFAAAAVLAGLLAWSAPIGAAPELPPSVQPFSVHAATHDG